MAKDRKIDVEDACPIPPGVEVPKRSELGSLISLILRVDWRVVLPVFSVGLLLTVYGLLIPLPPLFALPKDPETWNQPFSQAPPYHYRNIQNWVPKFQKQVAHEGNLILNSSEVFVIENVTYMVDGFIHVSDDARLVLRNAELWINETTWPYFPSLPMLNLLLTNSSRLEAFNSSIVADPWADIVLIDESRADIASSNFTYSNFICGCEAQLKVERSIVFTIDLANRASCIVNDSELDYLGGGWGTALIFPWERRGRIPWTETRAEVVNSEIVMLSLRAAGSSINIIGNVSGLHQSWSPSTIIQGGRFFNVTLVKSDFELLSLSADDSAIDITNNSDITGLSLRNSSLTLENGSFSYLKFFSSEINVSNSVIDFIGFNNESDVTVTRTLIDYLIFDGFNWSLNLEQVRATRMELGGTSGQIFGGIQIVNTTESLDSVGSTPSMLKRGYEVLTEAEESAIEGVELTLRNAKNAVVWTGKTESSGRAAFNVTYYQIWKLANYTWLNNATSTLTLTAKLGEIEQSQNVTLVSTTPIVFSFSKAPEHPVWADRTTLMLSGVIIMVGAVGFATLRRKAGERV